MQRGSRARCARSLWQCRLKTDTQTTRMDQDLKLTHRRQVHSLRTALAGRDLHSGHRGQGDPRDCHVVLHHINLEGSGGLGVKEEMDVQSQACSWSSGNGGF